MTRFPFERHDVWGNRVAGENGFASSKLNEIGAVCQEAFKKTAGSFLGLPGLGTGEKINGKPVKQTRGQAAMKTWTIVVGVLIVLFCLSYLVHHPSAVDQTFAKVFQHNGAETP